MVDFRLDSSKNTKNQNFRNFLLRLLRIKNFGIFQKPISKNVAGLSTLKMKIIKRAKF